MDYKAVELFNGIAGFVFASILVISATFFAVKGLESRNNRLLTVAKLIEKGVDPIAAGCAVGIIDNSAICRGAQK